MLHISGGRFIQGPKPPPNDSQGETENRVPASDGQPTSQVLGRRPRGSESDDSTGGNASDNLSWGPRKKLARTDPLVGHGRHFGRTVHAFCRIFPLIKEGLSRQLQLQASVLKEEDLSDQEIREHRIFLELLELSPGLDKRIIRASADELHYVSETLNKGANEARAGDIKSLKSAIVDWLAPSRGSLSPPLSRNVKTDRGFFHEATGSLLCPATLDWNDAETRDMLRSGEIAVTGDVWPTFLYRDHKFNDENPWDGLLEGELLVLAYKYVFTSPSSVESHIRATRSGNAEIHGMKEVTVASLAYIATLVRFALSSSAVFCRNDRSTDSERFYKSIVDWLESPTEKEEVEALMKWWNGKIFPSYHGDSSRVKAALAAPSVMDKLKAWRERKQSTPAGTQQASPGASNPREGED